MLKHAETCWNCKSQTRKSHQITFFPYVSHRLLHPAAMTPERCNWWETSSALHPRRVQARYSGQAIAHWEALIWRQQHKCCLSWYQVAPFDHLDRFASHLLTVWIAWMQQTHRSLPLICHQKHRSRNVHVGCQRFRAALWRDVHHPCRVTALRKMRIFHFSGSKDFDVIQCIYI